MIYLRFSKSLLLLIFLFAFSQRVSGGQENFSLSIDLCYARAISNYPLVKQFALIDKSNEFSIENASKGYLPKINIGGQASYQSDVIHFPLSLAGVPRLSKDQYKVYGEIIQPLTDLSTVSRQKELIDANTIIKKQELEVDIYKVKERINQLFFGALLIEARLKLNDLLKEELRLGIKRTTVAIDNGVALKSSVDLLNAELLRVEQQNIELNSTRKGFLDMLSLFIDQPLGQNTVLETPDNQLISSTINRPELKLFDSQKKAFDIQDRLGESNVLPKFNLFFQGGYGRPALNLLSDKFEAYYIGGLRLNWNISGFYTRSKEKKLIDLNKSSVDVGKETFIFNTNLVMKQQNSEIDKINKLMVADNDIIVLRENIKNSSKNQLTNGVITTNDYLSYLIAEDKARQDLILHKIQLLMVQFNHKVTTGN
jgi:outer membrane protein TolC